MSDLEPARPGIPAPLDAICTASTQADGIMVGCDAEGPHERHRGTYVREFAAASVDVEVSWETGEPAEAGPLVMPADEFAAVKAVARRFGLDGAKGDRLWDALYEDGAGSPAPVPAGAATAVTEPAGGHGGEAAPGRVERDTAAARTLVTAALLAEVGRRLYEYENAITWNTGCLGCAAKLDQDYALTMRAEQAEATLAAIRSLCGEGAPAVAVDRIEAILGTQERSDEEGPDRG